jgi:flavodoxin
LNIGIIVYSQTGHTLLVAEKLAEALKGKGHSAAIERVEAEGELDPTKPAKLKSVPDAGKYDALVLAAPVMAFSLNPAMKAYLSQLKTITGKKAGFLVTKQWPSKWTGGNGAVKTMKTLAEAKGGITGASGIVGWGKDEAKRETQMQAAIDALSGMF